MAQLDDRKAITVAELRERLAAFPDDFHVHLDFMVEDVRHVRTVADLTTQDGFKAVALHGWGEKETDIHLTNTMLPSNDDDDVTDFVDRTDML